jgi:hypothetical protein
MTAPGGEQVSGGLAFATPGDWFALRVPRERTDAATLTDRLIAARPELAAQRDAVDRMLRGLFDGCASLDVLCAYTTALDVPGGPLPATLLASMHPMDGLTVDRIAADMSALDDPALDDSVTLPEVGRFDLPVGRTARIERLREWGTPGQDHRIVSLVVQYVAEIPGTGNAIMLTFSTPAVALAGQLRQLFHQIACTLRFEGQEQQR